MIGDDTSTVCCYKTVELQGAKKGFACANIGQKEVVPGIEPGLLERSRVARSESNVLPLHHTTIELIGWKKPRKLRLLRLDLCGRGGVRRGGVR